MITLALGIIIGLLLNPVKQKTIRFVQSNELLKPMFYPQGKVINSVNPLDEIDI